jgi:hypothetical protein
LIGNHQHQAAQAVQAGNALGGAGYQARALGLVQVALHILVDGAVAVEEYGKHVRSLMFVVGGAKEQCVGQLDGVELEGVVPVVAAARPREVQLPAVQVSGEV